MKVNVYFGLVIDNDDPDKVGKVKIRIPAMHGTTDEAMNYVEDEFIPWFEPCVPWYGGFQSGSFVVPPVGSVLWCLLNENEEDPYQFFLYLGGTYGTGCVGEKVFAGKILPKGELETPSEALGDYPDSSIIFKSLSGSIIWFDGDGTIHLNIDLDTGITLSEQTIKIESDKSVVTLNPDNVIIEYGDNVLTINDDKVSIKAKKVEINADEVIVNGTPIGNSE